MEKYFVVKPNKTIEYIGEFDSNHDAYEYVEYDSDINYTWIINLSELKHLDTHIRNILDNT